MISPMKFFNFYLICFIPNTLFTYLLLVSHIKYILVYKHHKIWKNAITHSFSKMGWSTQ